MTSMSSVAQAAIPPKSEAQERTIVVENDLYRVEFSNRGAVVKSWQLKKYTDDSKPPRILDLVHPDAAQQTGGGALAVGLNDRPTGAGAHRRVYQGFYPAAHF